MKTKLALKTLYRSPVRIILTFILLVAVTFTLFSQVLEYAVTVREIDKAVKQYEGVGTAEVLPAERDVFGGLSTLSMYYATTDKRIGKDEHTDGLINAYVPLTYEQVNAISEMEYITFTDTRFMTAGICDAYVRMDDGEYFYNYNALCVIEATFERAAITLDLSDSNKEFELKFSNPKLISGSLVRPLSNNYSVKTLIGNGGSSGVGTKRAMVFDTTEYKYQKEFVDSLIPGNRYVFVIRYEPLYAYPNSTHVLGDYITETWSDTFWDVTYAPENYLETEEFADIKAVADIVELSNHTFDVVYTDYMGSIVRFSNGNMVIVDGSSITPECSSTNPNVCVISREFAQANNLSVGDMVEIKLGDKLFEQFKGLGAIPLVPKRVADSYTEVTLEIIGIYADMDSGAEHAREPNWTYSVNTIFVPKALLNVSETELENHMFVPGEFSFVVGNPEEISLFMDDCAPQIESMGLTLIFDDQGWLDIREEFSSSQKLGTIKVCVISAAVVTAIWLISFLYISGRKRDYAVMRVLGTNKRMANNAIMLPFLLLTVIAIILSALTSVVYTSHTIEQSNSIAVLTEFEIDTSMPIWIVIICVITAIFIISVFAYMLLYRLGKRSPLELIQNNQNKEMKRKAEIKLEPEPIVFKEYIPIDKLHKSEKCRRRFIWKYVFRHIKRTTAKSLLTILLAALLLNVVGQLDIMRDLYAELVENTEVSSNYIGGLPLGNVISLQKSGYAKEIYYSTTKAADVDTVTRSFVITNDFERYMGEGISVRYDNGKDESCFNSLNSVVLISEVYSKEFGLNLGDTVRISAENFSEYQRMARIASHREAYPGDQRSDDEIVLLYLEEMTEVYHQNSTEFIIAGIFSVQAENYAGEYDYVVFSPGTLHPYSEAYGVKVPLDVVEATVADNNLVDEYREFGQELAGGSVTEGVMFVMDTSKLENLRNTLRLVEMLYPIAVVVTLVIGAFLCGLIIVQTSKDIAIMRVLGTSKAKTRTILVLEQMILCIIGIIISGSVLYIRGALMQMLWVFGAYALVILLASIIASVAASHKNVLELLQTKE